MTDRELLELAAKAHGRIEPDLIEFGAWNPLADDGDALRLAVKLSMSISYGPSVKVVVTSYDSKVIVTSPNDLTEDTTRRAIVRAAAEIGKEMP